MPIFDGAFAAGADYLDMAMRLSHPHPEQPYELAGVKLGDEQFAQAAAWEAAAGWRWSASASSPAWPTSSPATPPTTCSARSTSSACATAPTSWSTGYDFAPSFSIWTTIEECLNPPVIWEKDRGWFTTAPFSEPEVFDFPEGIGPVECVNVEHEEVLLMPRWVDAKRVTFKYGLGDEFIDVLKTLHKLGLDRTEPVKVRGGRRSRPRDVVAACLPDPAALGDRDDRQDLRRDCGSPAPARTASRARSTSTTWSTTSGRWREYGAQAVVWQTAINPVVALELLATGAWSGAGVLGPEAFDAGPVPRPAARRLRPGRGVQERTRRPTRSSRG